MNDLKIQNQLKKYIYYLKNIVLPAIESQKGMQDEQFLKALDYLDKFSETNEKNVYQ